MYVHSELSEHFLGKAVSALRFGKCWILACSTHAIFLKDVLR